MDKVLAGLEKYAAAYIDDVAIYSDTWEEHLVHVLQRIHRAGLTVKARKCQFAMDDILRTCRWQWCCSP